MDLKDFVGLKIKEYRKYNRLTQKDLAEKLGVTKQTVSRYEKGERKANQDILFALCDIFGVTIDDFFPSKNDSIKIIVNTSDINVIYNQLHTDRQIKVYDYATEQLNEQNNVVNMSDYIQEETEWYDVKFYGSVSAGTGLYLDDEQVETISFGADMVPTSTDFCLKVNGDSMEPTFHNGDYVFIKRETEFRNGTIGAVIVNSEAYLKKIYITDNSIKLVSLNKKYQDITVTDTDNFKYVGTVVF